MEDRDRARLSPSEGRRFSFPVGSALLGVAALLGWREHEPAALTVAGLGGLLILAGLLAPTRLGRVRRSWMWLAGMISRVTTPIFLGALYFGVITPVGVLRRLFGSNPVVHRSEDDSYWKRRPADRRRSDLERLY